ncbi:DUF1302 domain-containing protein [Aromatoleum toluclasticum]|uniref:DUF1302 domain-containing protein n=1 Tax=Aromatoleum toluclasticum TaxID=92003 RepID=UPI0004756B8B|nr:DUF1302 domain-containing protein [Aromatoleum toluclasticum]
MKTLSRSKGRLALTTIAGLLAAGFSGGASAITEFEFGDGWQGAWSTTVSLGTSIRAQDRNRKLYGPANGHLIGLRGGLGANNNDEGNLNYEKGDAFSTLLKVISEVEFKKGDMGGLIRAKAWYDYTQSEQDVHWGNQPNGYNGYDLGSDRLTRKRPLSDKGYDDLLRFEGIELLDAFVYDTFDVGGNPLQVRLGKQGLNWGESMFIAGVNQINPIDIPAARRPGAQVKEVLMPVWMASANQSLGEAGSVEAFYQFKWAASPVDGSCGNYWSTANAIISTHPGNCFNITALDSANVSTPQALASNTFARQIKGDDAKDTGQFGVAYRLRSNPLDTEFGLYAMKIHARLPTFTLKFGDFGTPSPVAGLYEYKEDIKVYGASASTTLGGVSVSAELSTTRDYPLQLDGTDMFFGAFGAGPLAGRAAAAAASSNRTFHGYDLINKNQFQMNFMQAGNRVLGADQYALLGEIAYQWNDKDKDTRYGRPSIFGIGPHSSLGGNTCATLNRHPDGCSSNDGYVTRDSWGYRLYGQLEYTNVRNSGVTVTPSVFWAHDVDGYAADGAFIEDRTTLGLGVKFSYAKKYVLDLGYTRYGDEAKFDPLRDRDYYSANFSVTF